MLTNPIGNTLIHQKQSFKHYMQACLWLAFSQATNEDTNMRLSLSRKEVSRRPVPHQLTYCLGPANTTAGDTVKSAAFFGQVLRQQHDLQIRRVLYHPEVNTRCDTAELGQVPSPNERPSCLVSDCTLGHFSPALSPLRKEKPTHISYVCLSMLSFCYHFSRTSTLQ